MTALADRWRRPPAVDASVALHAAAAVAALAVPGWWPGLLAGVAANHLVLAGAGLWPHSSLLGPTLARLPPGGRGVALTFDDGPDPQVTPAVLAMLRAAGARASFFCIGARAQAHPDLVRAMLRDGHTVENHTHTHPLHFAALGLGGLRREVAGAQAALTALGAAPRWFRAPMGLRSPLLGPVLARSGLQAVSWTRRGFDTRCRVPATVLRRVSCGMGPGSILLLHDGNASRGADGAPVVLTVLPALLAALADRGLSAIPLPGAPAMTAGAAGS